ncbi:MAG: ribonuclease HI family protein [bacterium]|nr:ribonuclease HI family protein [bacterium]MDP3770875.1 ribonuclease HI family protein [bacterium]
MHVRIFTDGGARGNPGPAGIGVAIQDEDGKMIEEFGDYIGETTNNQAEYRAMIAALERAKVLGATEVSAFADSELLVKQLHRVYRVKNPGLAPLFVKIWNLAQSFTSCTFQHVRRERNKDADRMVNAAIDVRGEVRR